MVDFFFQLTIEQYIILSFLLFIAVFQLMSYINNRKALRVLAKAPQLRLRRFQVSPMGRDASCQLKNMGPEAIISLIEIPNRPDLVIKNNYSGHRLGTNKDYRLLLEAEGKEIINKSIDLSITFMDVQGNTYRQIIDLSGKRSTIFHVIKYSH